MRSLSSVLGSGQSRTALCRCARARRELTSSPPEVPAEFWLHPQLADALTSRHIGRVFAAYRNHPWHGAPIAQHTVANWLRLTQTAVSRIENGPPIQNIERLQDLAQLLQIPPAALWFKLPDSTPTNTTTARDTAAHTQQEQLARQEPQRGLELLGAHPSGNGPTFVGGIGQAGEWGTRGALKVAAVHAMSTAFQVADRKVGGGVLYGQVVRYLNSEIGPQLLSPASSDGAALFEAACSITEIAGWMAHDGGHDALARRHFQQAHRLAAAADHDALVGNVCASMSHLAGQLRQPQDAIRIAEVGLTHAKRKPGTTRLVARLHTMRARGHATNGDGKSCTADLADAERTLAGVGNEQPAAWIAGFDEASFASEAALCLRQLGDLSAARDQAQRVIALRVGDRVRARAFGQLTLARVLADSGHVDEAANIGLQLCSIANSLASARVTSRLDNLANTLRVHAAVPEVAQFLTCLASTSSAPTDQDCAWPV